MENNYTFSKEHTLIAKGLAMVLMLFDHLFWARYGGDYFSFIYLPNGHDIPWMIGSVGNICVSMFLFLSGYGMFCIDMKKEKYSFKDAFIRIKNIWIQYALITTIFILLDLMFGKIEFNLKTIILNYLALDYEYNAFAWFMITYIVIMIIFPIISFLFKKFHWYIELLIIVLIKVGITVIFRLICEVITVPPIIYNVFVEPFMFLPVFLLGYVCAKYQVMETMMKIIKYKIFLFIIFILTFLFMMIVPNTIFDNITAPILVFSASYLLHSTLLGKIFKFIGKHSTNMWLVHFPIMVILIPNIIYAPRYWLFVLLELVLIMIPICYGIDFVLNLRRKSK